MAGRTITVGPPERLQVDQLEVGAVRRAPGVTAAMLAGSDVWVQCSAHGEVRPAVVDPAIVEPATAQRLTLRWHVPQRRVAPGQSVVLYDSDGPGALVLAGGLAT